MGPLPHLFPAGTVQPHGYKFPGRVGGAPFRTPPRDEPGRHGALLVEQITAAEEEALAGEVKPAGVVLDFSSDPNFKLQLESLEAQASGIELRNSRIENGVMHATVFVPEGKIGVFVRKFERYAREERRASGSLKNKNLSESITEIRLAAVESFWTDAGPFPTDAKQALWWEVWLRDEVTLEGVDVADVAAEFRASARAAQVAVSERALRFPERCVLLAKASVEQWATVPNLFDLLAELRLAKPVPSAFLNLRPREQSEEVERFLARISPPPATAPALCLLDRGVNRGHPLLRIAMDEQHVLACDPAWTPADRHGHGTAMAGLGLYGCLTEHLGSTTPIVLRHRLESVKILPDRGENDPDLYGDITIEAIGRIEIAAPGTPRAICLTVTTDGRDEGLPSSWSSAIDKVCSGADDDIRRLMVVSAGNLELDVRHEYPNRNHLSGIDDPAQAWNALTVGAYTERAAIRSPEYSTWSPIAEPGGLCPGSRTSSIWADKTWPLKPDIVMEGGNNAIDPNTDSADFIDDLSLLTTYFPGTGALLTTTGDTSAAATLATRYAAIIWSHYPRLWPESVRAILVHSARWTRKMVAEFPHAFRHARLRAYGYGVPSLSRALWSTTNAATLVLEGELQPYERVGTDVKTKHMHVHRLPWPTDVLQKLGEVDIRMRVTLSYFIEPSPGRRGWTRRHRYGSHGLRFDVKKPLESDEEFTKRLSAESWEEDERVEQTGDGRGWEIGQRLRSRGSIHSDTWVGTAAELAACNAIGVFPITGWWRERKHLGRHDKTARYSLVVTIESRDQSVDLYTPIATQIGVPVVPVVAT